MILTVTCDDFAGDLLAEDGELEDDDDDDEDDELCAVSMGDGDASADIILGTLTQ